MSNFTTQSVFSNVAEFKPPKKISFSSGRSSLMASQALVLACCTSVVYTSALI